MWKQHLPRCDVRKGVDASAVHACCTPWLHTHHHRLVVATSRSQSARTWQLSSVAPASNSHPAWSPSRMAFQASRRPAFFPRTINESHERLSKLSSAAWADRMAPSGAGTLLVGRRARKTGRKRGWKSVPRKLADSQTQAAAAARSVFDGGAGESQKRASEASMLDTSSIRMPK